MLMRHDDIVVVGGGPAGAYCAYELARRGISATIYDNSYPREKPCGGGISPLALKKFPFLERLRSRGNTVDSLKVISCTDKETVMDESNHGFNISRSCLDTEILNMALRNGAKLIKEKVVDVSKQQHFWKIRTNRQSLLARVLVGADGINSIVRRKTVGSISKDDLALAYGYLGTGISNKQAVVKFVHNLQGYIWIFPRENDISIGIGSDLNHGNRLRMTLDAFMCSSYCNFKTFSRFAAMLPSVKHPDFFMKPCTGKDWILIGDAAGHVDPITGEGIPYALWSAKLAAKVLVKSDLESYDVLWRKEYGRYLMKRAAQKVTFFNPLRLELSLTMWSMYRKR